MYNVLTPTLNNTHVPLIYPFRVNKRTLHIADNNKLDLIIVLTHHLIILAVCLHVELLSIAERLFSEIKIRKKRLD